VDKTDNGRTFDELVARAKVVSSNPCFVAMALMSASPTAAGKRAEKAGLEIDLVKGVADLARIFHNFPERLMELWESKGDVMSASNFENGSFPKCPKFEVSLSPGQRPELDNIEKLFGHMAAVLQFMLSEGMKLLKKEAVLSYQEWHSLSDWAFQAWYYGVGGDYSKRMWELVIERGIKDLAKAVEDAKRSSADVVWKEYSSRGTIFGAWVVEIQYNLCNQRIEYTGRRNKLIALMRDTVMIPLYRRFRPLMKNQEGNGELFRSLAVDWYPGDTEAQNVFIRDCMARVNELEGVTVTVG
jgi:hypothetical protein